MPDHLPPGPELDRMVAEAMGLVYRNGLWHVTTTGTVGREPPPYSTQAWLIPEMVKWLSEKSKYGGLCMDTFHGATTVWAEFGSHLIDAVAETIQHALALLVVAVATTSDGTSETAQE